MRSYLIDWLYIYIFFFGKYYTLYREIDHILLFILLLKIIARCIIKNNLIHTDKKKINNNKYYYGIHRSLCLM